ncbi:hypothetical protein HOB25_02745 [bacterium]|nr:hypothetical protein [bacterium]
MKKHKKIAKIFCLAMLLLLLKTENASAEPQCQIQATKGVTIDLERMSECMEDRYGFDQNAMRRGNRKKMVPTVEVSFNKTDPQEGEKVTALSAPKGFKTDLVDLYYTWYIIHTNPDGSYANTIEEGKQEAMGIIARGEFDSSLFGIDYSFENDNDGYNAAYGGDDGVGAKPGREDGEWDDEIDNIFGDENEPAPAHNLMFDEKKQIIKTDSITRCYRHNFGAQTSERNLGNPAQGGASADERAGRDRIIDCDHEFARCFSPGGVIGETGDGDFTLAEEECWGTDPTNSDTDGDGVVDEADLAGLNQTQLTWIYRPGDRIGVIIEGTSMVPISEGGAQTGFEINGYLVTNPVTGAVVAVGSRGAASAYCNQFLPDGVDMGDASASGTGGTGGTGGSASTNIDLEADMTAYNLGMSRYDACDDSIRENYASGDVTDNDGELNAYYKIMWATPGICSGHDESMNYIGDDDCDPGFTSASDWGFPYQASVSVNETGGNVLDPELSVIPEAPQYDAVEPITENKRSDLVKVNASMSNENVNEDFLYYKWTVDRCEGNDFSDCEHPISGLEYETFTEGLGLRELRFFPTSNVFGALPGSAAMAATENRAWVRATVVVSEHESLAGGEHTDIEGLTVGAIERIYFPITKNVVGMNLYRAQRNAATGRWERGPQICNATLYKDICPVYPYEVLVAETVTADGTADFDRYSWQIDEQKIPAVVNIGGTCRVEGDYAPLVFPGPGCDEAPEKQVFFPVLGVQDGIMSIAVTNKRDDSDFVTQRILSVGSPQAVIEVVAGALATTSATGIVSDSVFEADNGTAVTFRATPVPTYMTINTDAVQDDDEVDLVWYVNDVEIDAAFLALAPQPMGLGITVANDQISFTIPSDMTLATGIDLKARLVKNFSNGGANEYTEMLKDTWRVIDTHTLAMDTAVSVRTGFNAALAQDVTLKQYLASSVSHAPHYLVFTIRLAIAMVLIWSVLFGFSYAVKLNKEL